MSTSTTTSPATKKSKAVLRLETIQAKETALAQQRVTAEAAVAEEKHAAKINQGLSDFLALMKQKKPEEIDAIIAIATSGETPTENVETIQHWRESLRAARCVQAEENSQK